MNSTTDIEPSTSKLRYAFHLLLGLLILPFLVLRRPQMILEFGRFLRESFGQSRGILLSSPRHRHRIQFETVDSDPSLEQLDAARMRMADLAHTQDWIALGEQLEEWDQTQAACVANKRFIHPGLDSAIDVLIAGRPGARRCEPLDIARIPDELIDDAMKDFKQDPNRYGLAALIVRMLFSQCWDLRGQMWADSVSDDAWDHILQKYNTALSVLDQAKIDTRKSSLLFGERQSLLYFSPEADRHIDKWFKAAVKADPGDSAPLMGMGNMMLPRWFGDYDTMETTARQAIVWTNDDMGSAAYAILYNDALSTEAVPLYFLDIELYTEAVHDLVKYRGYSPVYLPELSQFLASLSGHPYPQGMTNPEDQKIWDDNSHAVRLLSLKILEEYLPAIHPSSWINGERGALNMISHAMGQELEDGLSLKVGPRGISIYQPAEHAPE
ncbi:MAG: hypothetical protein ABJ246_05015 [Paracoccaceae bacterium]